MNNQSLDPQQLMQSIAYCGLICHLCFLSAKCDGCKSDKSLCEHDMSDKGCFQKQCCIAKAFEGCWECAQLWNCKEGIFEQDNFSKVKAFSLYIQKVGKASFIADVVRNTESGLSVEKGKDYDNLEIGQVHKLLKYGYLHPAPTYPGGVL